MSDWRCPIHGTYKVIPAGTTKAGKAYGAFIACGAKYPPGCSEKPPHGTKPIESSGPASTTYVGMAGDDFEGIEADDRNAWRDAEDEDTQGVLATDFGNN